MPTIHLIRHGQAAANWQQDPDPGLSPLGQQQAEQAAKQLVDQAKPQIVYSSPKLRAYETALPLADLWQQEIEPLESVVEIPSTGIAMHERGDWLKRVFSQRWSEQNNEVQQWREQIINTIKNLPHDAIIFSHFVVINALVAHARGDDKVFQCQPDYCSAQQFSVQDQQIKLLSLGKENHQLVL